MLQSITDFIGSEHFRNLMDAAIAACSGLVVTRLCGFYKSAHRIVTILERLAVGIEDANLIMERKESAHLNPHNHPYGATRYRSTRN